MLCLNPKMFVKPFSLHTVVLRPNDIDTFHFFCVVFSVQIREFVILSADFVGISDSHNFARRFASSKLALCLKTRPNFEAGISYSLKTNQCRTKCLDLRYE